MKRLFQMVAKLGLLTLSALPAVGQAVLLDDTEQLDNARQAIAQSDEARETGSTGLSVAAAAIVLGHAQRNVGRTDRMIVKLRGSGFTPQNNGMSDQQLKRLGKAAGVKLERFRLMSGGAHVLKLPEPVLPARAKSMAQRVEDLSNVEYAEPDAILRPTRIPNDTLYSQQWHYYEPTGGIRLPAAWDITIGSSAIIGAVIDTGIRSFHPDLRGRVMGGYDFISDAAVANDGDGRDGNPADPGDFVTSFESTSPISPYFGCPITESSWHGTHVAGTFGAATNNGTGVAGVNWVSKILPVRVLGKCGGFVSDIVDGMRWAAGLPVPNVPPNATPAQVLNLSLGGSGPCGPSFQDAVDDIVASSAVIVVAAGNEASDASGSQPGSCNGVITVAATNRQGDLAFYSNFGTRVTLSAPGGEQSSPADPNGVLSTLNTGDTTPAQANYEFYQGTSMAAPHVSGVISLMLSVNSGLAPSRIANILRFSSRSFPAGTTCTNTPNFCGAGILNANRAVRRARQLTSQ